MTDNVRTGYRNHRKAAWGLALLLVAAIATVTIPLASGAPSKTLQFVPDGQPPAAVQKTSPATSAAIAVAVFSGGQKVNSQGQTPSLSASGAGTIANFTVSGPTYSSTTKNWTWTATPKSDAPSGFYNFVATLGNLDPATSNTFRVAEFVCPPSCDNTSTVTTRAPGRLRIADTFGSPVALDFQADLPVPKGCNNNPNDPNDGTPHTWNRLYIDTNGNGQPDLGVDVFFPAVALDFNYRDAKMLQVTYEVRNSDWIQTNAARGNNDIELCAVAQHQDATRNNGAAADKFAGKYGPSTWDQNTKTYSGVLTTVSNASKVKTDPAICGRGGFTDVSGVTWRTWTVCIPFDWDYKMG
jgi:hypothetical protein